MVIAIISRIAIACFLLFLTTSLHAQDEATREKTTEEKGAEEETGDAEGAKEKTTSGRHSISLNGGPAIYARGSILGDAQGGLDLLANLINSKILYSPIYSPIVNAFGPIYPTPEISLFSNQYGLRYTYDAPGNWSYGLEFHYVDIQGRVDMPASFINFAEFNIEYPGYYQVTLQNDDWQMLGRVVELVGQVGYHFRPREKWDPYILFSLGGGGGYLGRGNWGPEIYSAHLGFAGGLRLNFDNTYLYSELSETGYWLTTSASNPIDRKQTLVNPGRGSIYLTRVVLGYGVYL